MGRLIRYALLAGAFTVLPATLTAAANAGDDASRTRGFSPVRFTASDRVELRGETIGNGRIGIAIAHDADANFSEWEPAAQFLNRHCYRVLLFDYRSNPFESQSGQHSAGTFRFDRDIEGAVALLHTLGSKTIVLAGDGVGGLTALVVAHELGSAIASTFVLTAGGISGGTDTLGDPSQPDDLDALAAVRHVTTPILFIAARSDTNARPLYHTAATKNKRLFLLPESALSSNGFGLSLWTSNATWARDARAAILAFLPKR
jgi:pimeloyl-ACP methyl ester carboxylesterase